MNIKAFDGLDEGNDGLRRSDVVSKVFEVYKDVVDTDDCSTDSDLDEIGEDLKSEIISKIAAYYNIEIDRSDVHTVGELIDYVMTHDGETTDDILKNVWVSNEMLQGYANLRMINKFTEMGHSTEGFLGKIADTFLSMANTFKTNVFKFTKALKRSEMRLFVDGNHFLCKNVEQTPFTTYMNKDVDIPTGMITSYANSVEYVKAVYEQMDALNYGNNVLDTLKELRYKMYNNQLNAAEGFSPSRQVVEKERILKWAAMAQTKCYRDHGAAPKMKFKDAYASMEEFSGIKDQLLDMEDRLQDVNKFVDQMDDMGIVIGDMTTHIENNPLPPTFIRGLSDGVRIVGASFDLYGQTAMRQMALEHNHVINYTNLYKSK